MQKLANKFLVSLRNIIRERSIKRHIPISTLFRSLIKTICPWKDLKSELVLPNSELTVQSRKNRFWESMLWAKVHSVIVLLKVSKRRVLNVDLTGQNLVYLKYGPRESVKSQLHPQVWSRRLSEELKVRARSQSFSIAQRDCLYYWPLARCDLPDWNGLLIRIRKRTMKKRRKTVMFKKKRKKMFFKSKRRPKEFKNSRNV